MASDQPPLDAENEEKTEAQQVEQGKQPLNLLPFYVQLQNVFAVEISAKRFPVNITTVVNTGLQLNLMAINVDEETLQAEVILNVQVECTDEPPPFEISFKLLGHFTYTRGQRTESVRMYLEQGSVSAMLPFARELLLNLCTRLQVPLLMLPLVQLAPPPVNESQKEDDS